MHQQQENNNTSSQGTMSFSPKEVLLVVKENWYWVVVFVTLGFLAAGAYLRWTPPRYKSSSVLKLEVKSQSGIVGVNLLQGQSMDNYTDLVGEVEFIKSNLIYDDVIDKLNLKVTYHQKGKFMNEEKYNMTPFSVIFDDKNTDHVIYDRPIYVKFESGNRVFYGVENEDNEISYKEGLLDKELNINGFKFIVTSTDRFHSSLLGLPYFFVVHSYSQLKSYFNSNLKVDILNVNAKTIGVSFEDFNPQKAADIVNALDTIYLRKTLENKQKVQDQTIAFIISQLDSAEKKLVLSELNIETFIRNEKTISPSTEFTSTLSDIDVNKDILKALNIQRSYLKELRNLLETDQPITNLVSIASVLESPSLRSTTQNLIIKDKQLNQLKLTYNESTMAYKKIEYEVDELKKGLSEITNQELSIVEKEKEKVIKTIAQLQKRFYSLPSKETELTRLKRFYDLYEKFYLSLQNKKVEFGIAKAGMVPEFVILSKAFPNFTPISPIKKQIYAIGILIGFVLGILILIIKILSQDTIVSDSDLQAKLKAPLLGLIPKYTKTNLEFSKLVIDINPKSAISEAFRSIRTNIEFLCSLNEKRVFAITSTTSGEGKTFITVNLAGIIALSGKKVVVLDLDMRKPKMHIAFDCENTDGMSNILAGKINHEKCIRATQIEGLDFISAGAIPPNPTELMLRDSFDSLITTLKKTYDLIIIDTPPIGIVTDGNIVMKKTDLALFVMRAGYTKKGSENLVNTIYSSSQFSQMSVILNSVKSFVGYGYGYYEGDEEKVSSFLKRLFTGRKKKQ